MKFQCLDTIFKRFFTWLGYKIANNPIRFIVVPIIIAFIFSSGLILLPGRVLDDVEFLFSPIISPATYERETIELLFPMNYSENYDISRSTRIGCFGRVFILPKDNGTVLRKNVFDDIVLIDTIVNNVTITHEGHIYRYKDLCATNKGKCFENSILSFHKKIDMIEKGVHPIKYPVLYKKNSHNPLFMPIFFGGVTLKDGFIESAQAAGLLYVLDFTTPSRNFLSLEWEKAFIEAIEQVSFEHVHAKRFTSSSMGKELDRNILSVLKYFVLSVILMLGYSITASTNGNWLVSKPWLGIGTCFSSLLGVLAAYGFVLIIGQPWISMNIALLFILIGIGMDDTFVLLAAWWRTDPKCTVAERVVKSYEQAGISITITSITNFLCFCVGTFTPFPATYIFCTYAAVAILFSYLLQITFMGGVMVLCGRLETENRHSLFYFVKVVDADRAKDKGRLFQLLCTGSRQESNEIQENNYFAAIFRDKIGGCLKNVWVKQFIILFFLVYLGFGLYGCLQLEEGLELERLFKENSYAKDYYRHNFDHFSEYYLRVQMVITEKLNYADPKVQEKIENFTRQLEESPLLANFSDGLTESWLRVFQPSLGFYKFLGHNMTDEKVFTKTFKNSFLSLPANKRFENDLLYNEDETEILASRFLFQSTKIEGTNAAKHLVKSLREIAETAPFVITFYNFYSPFIDQFIMIRQITIDSISITLVIMCLVSFLFIPSFSANFLMLLSLFSIQIGILGFMTFWNVTLDPISMICLIMCVGFSVDNCAHILHSYRDSEEKDPNKRMQDALYKVGLPILQGCISSIIATVALILDGATIFWTFFRITSLVLLFGAMHSILLLPVLLSISDRKFKFIDRWLDPAANEPLQPQLESPVPQVTEKLSVV